MFALCIWLTNELVDTKVCAALTTVTTMRIHVMFEQNNRTTAITYPEIIGLVWCCLKKNK